MKQSQPKDNRFWGCQYQIFTGHALNCTTHLRERLADVEYCGAQLETIGDMQAIYICVSRRERRYIKTDSLLFVALRTIRAQFDIARFLSSLTMNKRYEARTTSVCDHYLRRAHIIEHQRCILRCSQLLQPLAARHSTASLTCSIGCGKLRNVKPLYF